VKISKAVPFALAVAGLFAQLPAIADGLAYKYPVVVPKPPVPPTVIVAPSSNATEVPYAKPIEAPGTKSNAMANVKPIGNVNPAPVESSSTNSSTRKGIAQWMVSRYEPLSERDVLEAVPDINRGHGGGK
jgi:hypothetical protein